MENDKFAGVLPLFVYPEVLGSEGAVFCPMCYHPITGIDVREGLPAGHAQAGV